MARKLVEINAASMADIAFLLLIFFIVSSTMDIDTGLYRILPQLPDDVKSEVDIKERNIFVVLVNRNDELFADNDVIDISQLKEKTVEFLTNPSDDEKLPEKKTKIVPPFGEVMVPQGVISLQNDNGTSYKKYIEVLDQLLAAGTQVRDDFSMTRFNKKYEDLTEREQQAVREALPVIISEAEPKNIGGE